MLPSKVICYWCLTAIGKCCYQSISVARALPSQTSLLVQSSELAVGAPLSKAFAHWESAIRFLSLRCRAKQCLFNLEGGKLDWNKNDHHSAPFQLPFMSPGILLFLYHHIESSCFPHCYWSNSAFGSQLLLGLSSQAWSDMKMTIG